MGPSHCSAVRFPGLESVFRCYCKGTYASVRLSKRIDYTGMDTVANEVRVIVHVYVYGKILGKDHDPHEQSI
jgi:hypothetical protein